MGGSGAPRPPYLQTTTGGYENKKIGKKGARLLKAFQRETKETYKEQLGTYQKIRGSLS